jgi:hypothetical protein
MLSYLSKLARMESGRRRYCLTAAWYLAAGRVRHGLSPSRDLLDPALSSRSRPPPRKMRRSSFDPGQAAIAIGQVASALPWRADCLVQAIAAQAWLEHQGYEPRMHVGVMKDTGGELRAHAWLELDGRVIVGGRVDGHVEFTTGARRIETSSDA